MKLIKVQYKKEGKQYLFYDNNLELSENDAVIVETEKGEQLGYVTKTNIEPIDDEKRALVLRMATKKDIQKNQKNMSEAAKALIKAEEIAHELDLDMKFIDSYYTLDQKQLIFNFVSDGRVDFRELAKSLASIYKTRIELRQVGVRDKAREVSGIGPCGRKLCCSCFLRDLDFVGINMVKNQNISLNPNKINGLCGRLLCCLKYEDDLYTENRKGMPQVGDNIKIENKEDATVIAVDIPRRTYKALTENGEKIEIKLESCCDKCEKKHCNKRSS